MGSTIGGVFAGAEAAVGADDLKGVAVQVHRMPHHRHVGKRERGALTLRIVMGSVSANGRPLIFQS